MDHGNGARSITRAGSVTRTSTVTRGWQRHQNWQRAPPQPAVPLLSAEGPATLSPWGAVPRGSVTAGPVIPTPITYSAGAPGFRSTVGWLCTVLPPSRGAPRARLPTCVPHCPFCLPGIGLARGPGLGPARRQAGSTGHPSSLPWGGRLGPSLAPLEVTGAGTVPGGAEPPLSPCPLVLPVLYATCYRL